MIRFPSISSLSFFDSEALVLSALPYVGMTVCLHYYEPLKEGMPDYLCVSFLT